ncbi:MAG TPA: hypothetical protein VGL44_13000 [Gaiellales bacterium]|jgi:hypothetical protein
MTGAREAETVPGDRIPRWVAPVFALIGFGLVPWTLWIAYDLPQRHLARHWDVAWVGFDVAMAALLLATAYGALRRAVWIQSTAAAAATMLVCDAWFDVTTASRGVEEAMALGSGLLIELPLAVICVWVARNAERAQGYMEAAGRITRRRARPR